MTIEDRGLLVLAVVLAVLGVAAALKQLGLG